MKVHYIALSSAGRDVEVAPLFESDGALREWLVHHAARSYCQESLPGKRTPAEAKSAFADAYDVRETPNGLWWAAIQWAAERGRGEWSMGVRETVRFGPDGSTLPANDTVTYIDAAYAATVVP